MKLTDGSLYWTDKNNIIKTYPYLTKNIKSDVVIIGGGITAAITAYFLAKEGVEVTICEKNILAFSSTSATNGLLEYQTALDLHKLSKLFGKNGARKIYELSMEALNEIKKIDKDISKKGEFKRKDSIYYSNNIFNKSNIIKEYETRKRSLFDVQYIETNELLNIYNGVLSKSLSGVINPYTFATYLFEYLNTLKNIRIYENTEIQEIHSNYDYNLCVTDNDFEIDCKKIIFCTRF